MPTVKLREITCKVVLKLQLPKDNYTDFDDERIACELFQEMLDQSSFGVEGIGSETISFEIVSEEYREFNDGGKEE
jgi:hypothetical protein